MFTITHNSLYKKRLY